MPWRDARCEVSAPAFIDRRDDVDRIAEPRESDLEGELEWRASQGLRDKNKEFYELTRELDLGCPRVAQIATRVVRLAASSRVLRGIGGFGGPELPTYGFYHHILMCVTIS